MSWFSDIGDWVDNAASVVVDTVGDVTRDVTKSVVKTIVTPGEIISGKSAGITFATGLGNGVLKPITNLGHDVATVAAYNIAAPINSVTGHKFDTTYDTGIGKIQGDIGEFGVNSIHDLAKTIGDTVTGGLASKLVNNIRDKDDRETYLNYNEGVKSIKADSPLASIETTVLKVGEKVGQAIGSAYGLGAPSSAPQSSANVAQSGLVPVSNDVVVPTQPQVTGINPLYYILGALVFVSAFLFVVFKPGRK